MIKIRIKDTKAMLAKATDSDEIARLESTLKAWKRHLHDAEMIEYTSGFPPRPDFSFLTVLRGER